MLANTEKEREIWSNWEKQLIKMLEVTKSEEIPLNSSCRWSERTVEYRLSLTREPRILLNWIMDGVGFLWWSNWLNEETRVMCLSSWWCNWEYNLLLVVVVVELEAEGMKLGFGSWWKLGVTGKWEVKFENDIVVWLKIMMFERQDFLFKMETLSLSFSAVRYMIC
jgi:hypothetical protein